MQRNFVGAASDANPCDFTHAAYAEVVDARSLDLPRGWEMITHNGDTVYLDHINRTAHATFPEQQLLKHRDLQSAAR